MKPLKKCGQNETWPYYINVYYKYIHGFFNIDNEFYFYFKNNII